MTVLNHADGDGNYTPIPVRVATQYSYLAAASANQDSQSIIANQGRFYGYSFHNNHASAIRYVKLYDKATAPTSADTPIARFPLAPGGGGVARNCPNGVRFVSGLAIRITAGAADNDTTAVGANDVAINIEYVSP